MKTRAAVAWKALFDGKTLTGWKEPNFSGQGEIEVKDGQMILGAGSDITGMNYTGETPQMKSNAGKFHPTAQGERSPGSREG